MAKTVYEQVVPGEWYRPTLKHKERCCDCKLVHKVEYKVVEGEIWMRVWRDERATSALRRKKAHQVGARASS